MRNLGHQSHLLLGGGGRKDNIDKIEGIHLSQEKTICSNSVFEKAKRYEVTISTIISTQINAIRNCIDSQYWAARIHEQRIWWSDNDSIYPVAFNIENIKVFCTCKYHQKKTEKFENIVHTS